MPGKCPTRCSAPSGTGNARGPARAGSAGAGEDPARADVQLEAGPHKAEAARQLLDSNLVREVPAPRPAPNPQAQAEITAGADMQLKACPPKQNRSWRSDDKSRGSAGGRDLEPADLREVEYRYTRLN